MTAKMCLTFELCSFFNQSLNMTDPVENESEEQSQPAPWKPLNRVQRRIVGVLVEKAKTTPDGYPMTLNSLTTGCNQKSNRKPQMNLEPEDVEDELDNLRMMGVVTEVHGSGRVAKFKHNTYEWFDVSAAELAVLTELLLRGEQTAGDLRARSARMDKSITDISALRPIMQSLTEKGLLIPLTPDGRGQIVSHAVFTEQEMERIKEKYSPENYDPEANTKKRSEPASPRPSESEVADLMSKIAGLEERLALVEERLKIIES